jgi:uncharacterized protein (UPF0264 family)
MKLLISVINVEEAQAAIAGGADIIDVKNPGEGSLGANFPPVLKAVREIAPEHLEVSATLGDAVNLPGTFSLAAYGAVSCGADLVKVGLYGITAAKEAVYFLQKVKEAAAISRPGVKVVAAGYADAGLFGALEPEVIPRIAAAGGVDGCMLDTARKNGATLLDLLSPESLLAFVRASHSLGLCCALAGSLQAEDLTLMEKLGVDIVGVRTAACLGNVRNGKIVSERVHCLKSLINLK